MSPRDRSTQRRKAWRAHPPEFERAARCLLEALSSRTPLSVWDFDRHFAAYQRHLEELARELLATPGGPDRRSLVQPVVERFHREMIARGFRQFLASGQKEFGPTARAALRTICDEWPPRASVRGGRV